MLKKWGQIILSIFSAHTFSFGPRYGVIKSNLQFKKIGQKEGRAVKAFKVFKGHMNNTILGMDEWDM
jgi:hypothetical protein